MFNYDHLSPNRRFFIDEVMKEYPDIQDSINKEQIEQVVNKTNLNYPQWFIVPENRISRGVYHFPRPVITEFESLPVEDIEERITSTFQSLDILVNAVSSNVVNSLVICGGAGIGKSHTVNEILLNSLGESNYVFHRGYLKSTHLFRMLWENRNAGQVIVLDDVDLWKDEQTLNMLKAALELKSTRKIGWGSEKEFEDSDGEVIPRYFDYEGSVIFLTNENIYDLIDAQNKNAPHLKAIETRSLVLDMKVRSKQEYLHVIKMKLKEGLLRNKGITTNEEEEILSFIEDNLDKMRDMSLRMVEKVASLYRIKPDEWQTLVKGVMFK